MEKETSKEIRIGEGDNILMKYESKIEEEYNKKVSNTKLERIYSITLIFIIKWAKTVILINKNGNKRTKKIEDVSFL